MDLEFLIFSRLLSNKITHTCIYFGSSLGPFQINTHTHTLGHVSCMNRTGNLLSLVKLGEGGSRLSPLRPRPSCLWCPPDGPIIGSKDGWRERSVHRTLGHGQGRLRAEKSYKVWRGAVWGGLWAPGEELSDPGSLGEMPG